MDDYDAVVYDLDGTLVDLEVDWDQVAREVAAVYRSSDVDPPSGDLWALLEDADDYGLGDSVAGVVCEHEREGARRSVRLSLADELLARAAAGVPLGVCSLNCEAAVRIALAEHDLASTLESGPIVGRDTVATQKPDPEPLLAACRSLGVTPERTLFVGDSPRDERTAERAGTRFAYVSDLQGSPDTRVDR
ncbi:MAG: HAD family hydrolase [Haloferacaceae archaeon]